MCKGRVILFNRSDSSSRLILKAFSDNLELKKESREMISQVLPKLSTIELDCKLFHTLITSFSNSRTYSLYSTVTPSSKIPLNRRDNGA